MKGSTSVAGLLLMFLMLWPQIAVGNDDSGASDFLIVYQVAYRTYVSGGEKYYRLRVWLVGEPAGVFYEIARMDSSEVAMFQTMVLTAKSTGQAIKIYWNGSAGSKRYLYEITMR